MPSAIKTIKRKTSSVSRVKLVERKSASQRGYNYKWQNARKYFLQENPLCCYCKEKGLIESATVVDHIIPHKGNSKLFWDMNNWQSLCKKCHDSDKQKIEKRHRGGRKVQST